MKLNVNALGLACGVLTGLLVVVLTLVNIGTGYPNVSMNIILDIYGPFGYKISYLGALLGLIYSFIDGYILGAVFALVYNKFTKE